MPQRHTGLVPGYGVSGREGRKQELSQRRIVLCRTLTTHDLGRAVETDDQVTVTTDGGRGIVAQRALASQQGKEVLVLAGEPVGGEAADGLKVLVRDGHANPFDRWDAEFPLHLRTLLERDLPDTSVSFAKGDDLDAPVVIEVGG